MSEEILSTGLPGLDQVLKGILPGDNIVWQVDAIDDYQALVHPYIESALRSGRHVVYFRFANHPALLGAQAGVEIHELRPEDGFETFLTRIHAVIERAGRGAFYVFDCLSDLVVDWYSDTMLGNFFMLTCPYLYDMETLAYFALLRNNHSFHATTPILETTQLFLDLHRHRGKLYIRPVKVQHRYSATMHLLHAWEGRAFRPVTGSCEIAEIMASTPWSGLHSDRRLGYWERAFIEAQDVLRLLKYGQCPAETERNVFDKVVRMMISRDEGFLPLLSRFFSIENLLDIRRRMIGTGLIGGKAVGMLLARAILLAGDRKYQALLEEHDSFFVGSDVFYTYLVRNGIWWARQMQRDPAHFMEGSEQARRRILTGSFPAHTIRQFEEMLDYFGQSPFIVRSSSLLEDNYGNAFAGKYDSVFCANQGPRERRLEDFLAAVRTIYASTMSEKALRYRAQRGLLERDEQMALLVMRVSGELYGRKFYPPAAGVGFSFNPYVWNENIDPRAGVVRLVFGLGTRAVNRSDDDYTRLVALNAPGRRPETNFDEVRQYAQRLVDYIDLDANRHMAGKFRDVIAEANGLPLDLLATSGADEDGGAGQVLTFDELLMHTEFVADMRAMLHRLEEAYGVPVDIEFTVNFQDNRRYRVNLVQCRPLQVRGIEGVALPRMEAAASDRIIEARGAVVGHSRLTPIARFVYIVPRLYGELPIQQRYEVARRLGEINLALGEKAGPVMLIGPGRWGTGSPSLGIPVSFQEINHAAVICEIVAMRKDLIPDVSLGTHFLNELVEADMLYLALFPGQGHNVLDERFFEERPNHLLEYAPGAGSWAEVLRVIHSEDITGPDRVIALAADAREQRVLCCLVDRQLLKGMETGA